MINMFEGNSTPNILNVSVNEEMEVIHEKKSPNNISEMERDIDDMYRKLQLTPNNSDSVVNDSMIYANSKNLTDLERMAIDFSDFKYFVSKELSAVKTAIDTLAKFLPDEDENSRLLKENKRLLQEVKELRKLTQDLVTNFNRQIHSSETDREKFYKNINTAEIEKKNLDDDIHHWLFPKRVVSVDNSKGCNISSIKLRNRYNDLYIENVNDQNNYDQNNYDTNFVHDGVKNLKTNQQRNNRSFVTTRRPVVVVNNHPEKQHTFKSDNVLPDEQTYSEIAASKLILKLQHRQKNLEKTSRLLVTAFRRLLR